MELEVLGQELTVCKVETIADLDLTKGFYFIGRTDEELSLVCETQSTPERTIAREDGWKGFRIRGVLDFSLVGILSRIAAILAEKKIGIFAVSTYHTDYVLVKQENLTRALQALEQEGYGIIRKE